MHQWIETTWLSNGSQAVWYKLKGAIPGDDLRKSHHSDPRSQLLAQSWPDPRDLPLGVDWNCGLLMFLNMEAIRTPHHIQSPSIPFTLVIKIGMWMFIHPFIQEINEHHGFWHIPNSFYVCFDTVPVLCETWPGHSLPLWTVQKPVEPPVPTTEVVFPEEGATWMCVPPSKWFNSSFSESISQPG